MVPLFTGLRASSRNLKTVATSRSAPKVFTQRRTMATPSKVKLSLGEWPEFYLPGMTGDSAGETSKCLQENHDRHHIFFNKSGFHNHIAHHLLTIYALGSSPPVIKKQYDHNKSYQRPAVKLDDRIVEDMHDPAMFKRYLGKEDYYHDFLVFFQKEMEVKGWQNVIKEYLFSEDERADDMLVRMFAGFLHPIIHLGFGIEFQQPAIVAEALAQAAVHDNWMGPLLLDAEEAAKKNSVKTSRALVDLLDDIRADETLRNAPKWEDGNKLRDGIVKRAPEAMMKYASQYVVNPDDDLEYKVAEMTNASVYYTGAAQRPPKQVKFDFFFIHCVNSTIFFSSFVHQPWLSAAAKARLLAWKGRIDLAMYASRGSPALLLDEIDRYAPKRPSSASADPWGGIFERIGRYEDDGHGAKLVRALAHGQVICGRWEGRPEFRVKGDMWLKLGHMAIDSVESGDPTWVRSCGFPQAWQKVEDRPRAQL